MPDYIFESACRGARPRIPAHAYNIARQGLIGKLLKERGVTRFVVAPDGFGKSTLVAQYAELVFSFKHVFWLDCKSPCFLRDLDTGLLAQDIVATDEDVSLCVFDDLPLLGDDRASLLSDCIDALLDRGAEVIVVTTPARNLSNRYQRDRYTLRAADLLVRAAEQEQFANISNVRAPFCDQPAQRIPCVLWGEKYAATTLFERFLTEELPARSFLVAFAVLLLQVGQASDVAALCPQGDAALQEDGLHEYLFLGFSDDAALFNAIEVPTEELSLAFKRKAKSFTAQFQGFDAIDFVAQLTQLLAQRGNYHRAAQVVKYFLPDQDRIEWFNANALSMVAQDAGGYLPDVYLSIGAQETPQGFLVAVYYGLYCCLAQRLDEGCKTLAGVAQSKAVPLSHRALAAAFLGAFAEDEEERAENRSLVSQLCLSLCDWDARTVAENEDSTLDPWDLLWRPLTGMALLVARNVHDAPALWEAWRSAGASWEALVLGAVLIARAIPRGQRSAHKEDEWYVFARAIMSASDQPFFSRLFRSLLVQPQHSNEPEAFHYALTSIPQLHVRLVGGLELTMDGEVPTAAVSIRKKTKALLGILALNLGHELPRDQLVTSLWPGTEPQRARRNLYTLWSQCRRMLALEDGTCPYLISQHESYQLNPRYVTSDVQEIVRDCRELQFGAINPSMWVTILDRFETTYLGEIMPAETGNKEIARSRQQYATLITDALTSAALRLVNSGEPQSALWFAREALSRDGSREDAYEALMRAQVAAGQRSSALNTYFMCQRVLSEELGIDPSTRTVRLYESILEEAW